MKWWAWLAALLWVLSGCAGATSEVPPQPTATVALLSATPLPTPTSTPVPTATPTATPASWVTAPAGGIPHYALDITLDAGLRSLEAVQRVTLVNDAADAWDEVVFAVLPAHQPEVFLLSQVVVTTTWQQQPVAPRLEGTMLHVPLPVPVLPGEPVQVQLIYSLIAPPVAASDWPPLENFGASARLIQAGDWYPTLVPYDEGAGWRTWVYSPVGDPTIYEIATYDVALTAAPEIVAAAAGEVAIEGETRYYHLDRARSFAFLASPEFQMLEGAWQGVPLRSYYLPEYAVAGQAVIDVATRALALFSELYGPYPYAELVIAQNAYYGAMEYAGLVSMTGYGYETYTGNPFNLLVSLTAHEIAHQWWYGAVGNDQVYEPWLDESFAKYSEVLYYERYHPELVVTWWQYSVDQWAPSGPVNRTIYDFSDTATYIHAVYGQGAHFMADLRALLGDTDFFAFTREYRAAHEGGLATREDFFAAVRARTDADLTPLIVTYFSD